jgi:signal transduction histidine kinase
MNFRIKLILSYIGVILAVIIFSFIFSSIFVRQSFVRIIIGNWPREVNLLLSLQSTKFLNTVRMTLVWSGVMSIFIGIGVALIVSNLTVKPLKEMQKLAKRISQGDYSARIGLKSRDEIGELASSLNYMAEQLTDIENMRKKLVQNVSHDLRTPLTSIKGYLELLEDESFTEEEKLKSINTIQKEVERMETIVKEITRLSIIDGKNYQLDIEKLDLNSVVKESIPIISIEAEKKNIQIQIDSLQKEVFIMGDKEKVKEVIINLLDNAIKFTNEGFIKISTSQNKNYVSLIIEDTGIGIDPEDMPHIFERFYRGEKSRSKNSSGLGIGLAIIKELVYMQNGKIEVESKKSKGSKFTVNFPVAD